MEKMATAVLAAFLLAPAGAAHAQQATETAAEGSWIHVSIEEADGETASINLPLQLVDAAVESGVQDLGTDDLRVGPDGDVSVAEMRSIWNQVRDTEEADFVDIRDGDERVRVYKRADRVHVEVDEDDEKKVRIELPSAIVDALLGGEDRLDMAAAARELARAGDGEFVRIDDRETRIRIWVDQEASQSGS